VSDSASPSDAGPRRARSPLFAVFLTVVIDLLGFGLILPLLPLYAKDYHASGLMVGLLFAAFSGMQFLCAPIWGRISDRVGRRPIIIVGLCGSVSSYVLFGLASVLPHPLTILFISRILAGFFGGTITTSYAYIADVTSTSERGRGMALIGAAFGIGFTIGPAVGGLGDTYFGHMGPGLIAAGFSTIALLFAIFRLPEPQRHKEAPEGALFRLGALPRALKIRGVPQILAVAFIGTFAFALFESTLALLAKYRFAGWDESLNGWLFSYLGFWLALMQGFVVWRFMKKVGEKRFAILGTLLLVAGLLAVGYAPTALVLGALAPLAVAGFSMMTPSLSSLLSQSVSAGVQGEVLGVNQSMQSLARIVGPVVGNAALASDLHFPYWFGAGLVAVGFLLALTLRAHPTPQGQAAPEEVTG
jgi:DHA1 family tetracycline resistance protein-like MFS transporter